MPKNDTDELDQDTVYDILSNARRRFVISYLREHDEPIGLNRLSEEVAAWENDTTVAELSDKQIKRVYVSLYQTHVPKLDEHGLVEYDKDSGAIKLTSNVEVLDAHLPDFEQSHTPWPFVYAGLAAVGLATYAVVLLLPATFSWVSTTALGVVITALFAIVTFVHYWVDMR